MKQSTIECNHISKHFGEGSTRVDPLKDVSFSVYPAELIMLMGPSGSGKTTLLSILGGILHPSEGTCLMLGKNLMTMDEAERTRFRGTHIGFIFQQFVLVPTLTAVENAAIPLLLAGKKQSEAVAEAHTFLTQFGLDSQRSRKPHELSGGEQQRVALARACIHRPDIILCDEPTSFLDRSRGIQIMELLVDLKNQLHTTIIVVTHDPRIIPYADRILELDDGKLSCKLKKED